MLCLFNCRTRIIDLISYGTKAELSFDAFADEILLASVSKIGESADPRTGTFEIELQLSKTKKRLRNGMIGRVKLLPEQEKTFVKIPMIAIAEGKGDLIDIYIPVHGDSIAKKKTLQVFRYSDEHVWANSIGDLSSRIITSGSAYLKDGQKNPCSTYN